MNDTYQNLGIDPDRAYYKYELAGVLGVHRRTLGRYLKLVEGELVDISPYSSRKQILSPRQIHFILTHFGYI